MKRLGLTPLLLPATLFLASRLQAADAGPAGNPAAPAPAATGLSAREQDLLKRFDKNHDGKLDEDEIAAAHEAMLQERMDRQAAAAQAPGVGQFQAKLLEMFDKNHDGRLDDEERAEARKYVEANGLGPGGAVREELMKRFDKNGDGKLDADEQAALQKFLQERRAQGANGPAAMRQLLLQQFDKNGDGKIDEAEMVELEKTMRPRMEANPAQLQRFDKNGDGKLDDTEWAAAREQLIKILNTPEPRNASAAVGQPGDPASRQAEPAPAAGK
jgi:Ca2+-binding EF-hand superfamily protein